MGGAVGGVRDHAQRGELEGEQLVLQGDDTGPDQGVVAGEGSRERGLGARLAEPGEFSKRAFLNDKLDLARAIMSKASSARAVLRESPTTCPSCKKPFRPGGPWPAADPELPTAKQASERFDLGRNFANKIWNAARLARLY